MARPLLSICIPTYNRARHVRARLEELRTVLPHTPEVELLISNNGSPDETQGVMEEYRSVFPRYRVLSHPVNLGADFNFINCMTNAEGEYLWLFSDDDYFLPERFPALLRYLREESPEVLILNQQIGESYVSREALGERMFAIEADERGSLHQLCLRHGYLTLLGFVTAIVLRKPNFTASDWARHQAYETALVHSTVTYEAHRSGKTVITAQPFIRVEPPVEHQSREHQSAQDPKVNFRTWTLNLSIFMRDLIERGALQECADSQFFLVPHCKMPLADHILGSFRNSIAELRELPDSSWGRLESFLRALQDEGRLRQPSNLRTAHSQVLQQILDLRSNTAQVDHLRNQLTAIQYL